ncbi:MAG: ATP-binding cassette domain-containing protein [Candidatus Heimdallarchaeaceae archaeon]
MLLRTKNIHKWFEKVHALRGVDFSIDSGEVVGLVGDNGAGKSTLVNILGGVYPPTEGEIYWQEEKVRINNVRQAREMGIETVYQDRSVIGSLSVFQNIFLGRELTRSLGPIKLLDIKKMTEEANVLTKKLGLSISSPYQEAQFLSGGERQGISIARVMYFKAKLVILDEPTRALSVRAVKTVLNFIRQLKKSKIACIFVSHNIYHVYPVADRFVGMSHGKIKFEVSKEEAPIEKVEQLLIS